MKLIDSHCHLDDFVNDGEIEAVLRHAQEAEVKKMVVVGTHVGDCQFYQNWVPHQESIFYTVGYHPYYLDNLDKVEDLKIYFSSSCPPVAIGEIGLDYHKLSEGREEQEKEQQQEMFRQQLAVARELQVPVVIHSRQAFDDTMALLQTSGVAPEKVLIHCFDYGLNEYALLEEWGASVSFSGLLTLKKKLATVLRAAKKERILIETDCPFLTPAPMEGKTNEPAYVRYTAAYGAELCGMSLEDFAALTSENAERFFGI